MEQDANMEVENPPEGMLASDNVDKFRKNDKRNIESVTEREDTAETSNIAEPFKRKRLVKGKGKVTRKSPATNSLNTTKAMEEDAKKEVENHIIEMLESNKGEKFKKDEDEKKGESPSQHEDNGEKGESVANQEAINEKAKFPTEKKSGNPTETSKLAEPPQRKRLVKGKGMVTRKSPATNSLNTIKAMEEDAKKEDERNVESPSKHEDNSEKGESAANQEDNNEKVNFPTEREDTKKKSSSPTETSTIAEPSQRKRLVKGKGMVTRKSPATNSLNTITAMEEDAKKEGEDERNVASSSKHEDNSEKGESAANQEDNNEKVKFQWEDTKKKASSPTETSNIAEPSQRKRLVKGKGMVTRKSPATNSLNTIKAMAEDAKKEDEDERNVESPSKHEDNSENGESAANQEANNEKAKFPTDKKSGNPTETSNIAEPSQRKRLVKGKGMVTRKSPATNSMNTIEVVEEDAKKEVENHTVELLESNEGKKFEKDEDKRNGESLSKHEDGEKLEPAANQADKAESSKRKRLVKVKGKIIKKTPPINSLSAIKAEDSPKVQGNQRMRKRLKETASEENIKGGSNEKAAIHLSSRGDKKKINTEEQHIQNINLAHTDTEMMVESQKSPKKVKNGKKSNASARNEKVDDKDKRELNKNRNEKLGGLIFMCNAKTKPDCFRYQIMGVSINKKDIVLAIKPGLKLFLYDFDLRLLYGIYHASSSGGMKLEPKAFHGAFPAQVRFKVDKDCFPLPEIVFKKAINENYYEKNKFKTELTLKQVRKLTELFRSADFHSSHSSKTQIRSPPRIPDRKVHTRSRDSRYEDSFANGGSRSYHSQAREREHKIAHRELSPIRREEIPRDLYLSEKEYRSYGLRGERRNVAPTSYSTYETTLPRDYARERVPRQVETTLPRDYDREHVPRQVETTLPRDYDREHVPRQVETTLPRDYAREHVPRQVEYRRVDPPPRYLEEKEHLSYGLRSDRPSSSLARLVTSPYANHPYIVHQLDLPPLRREEAPSSYSQEGRSYIIETNRRRDIDQADRLYSNASDALSHYNRTRDFHETKPETSTMPVSSRYSFAGPSFSYR